MAGRWRRLRRKRARKGETGRVWYLRMRRNATNSFVLPRKVEAVRRDRKTSPELLSVAARFGALGLLAAAAEKNKGGVRRCAFCRGRGRGSLGPRGVLTLPEMGADGGGRCQLRRVITAAWGRYSSRKKMEMEEGGRGYL